MKRWLLTVFGVVLIVAAGVVGTLIVPSVALTPGIINGCQYLASPPTLADQQTSVVRCDNTGALATTGGGGGGGTQNVNVSQVAGNSTSVDNGTSDSGTIRVTIASNSAGIQKTCGSWAHANISSATETQLVAASGALTIYVCDYSWSANGTNTFYLEKTTTGTCAATLTQIDQLWYAVAGVSKQAANNFYRGINTGASAQLCVHSTAAGQFEIWVNYDQS